MIGHFLVLHLGLIIGFFLSALIVTQVLKQRRSPAATVAWLLVIVLIPYVGVPLYMLLGVRKIRRRTALREQVMLPYLENNEIENANIIDKLLRTYHLPGATGGNRVQLCPTGEDCYRKMVALIEGATKSIYIATFILGDDEVGRDIFDRLVRQAVKGIKIRLLLDGVGSFRLPRKFLEPLKKAGGRTKLFIPVVHNPFRGGTNLRNHRKIMVIDERVVMAGGTNIANEYIGPTPTPGRWRDLSFVLEGPAVRCYTEIFRSDWEFASGENITLDPPQAPSVPSPGDGAIVQVVPTGPDVAGDPLYDAIVSAAYSAQKRFWVVTPYFVPDDGLVQALTLAAHRGVDLQIIVPKRSNHIMADLARGSSLRAIHYAGGRILYYSPGMLHAKVILSDHELAVIGSANMDMRSLFLDHEVVMFMYSGPEIRATEEWIKGLAVKAQPTEEKVGPFRDIGEGLVRMLAPLL